MPAEEHAAARDSVDVACGQCQENCKWKFMILELLIYVNVVNCGSWKVAICSNSAMLEC